MAKQKKAKRANASKKRTATNALAVATNSKKATSQRVAALALAPLAVSGSETDLQRVLKLLANPDEPIEVRFAALDSLQTASFDATYVS